MRGKGVCGSACCVQRVLAESGCPVLMFAQGAFPTADVTITYASERVFIDVNRGAMAPTKAVLLGKIKVRGALATTPLFRCFHGCVRLCSDFW